MLTREAILQKAQTRIVRVTCEPLGMDVFVRTMTGEDKDIVQGQFVEMADDDGNVDFGKVKGFRSDFVSRFLCNEKGEELLAKEDVDGMCSEVVEELFDICMTTNGFREAPVDEAKKNSEETESSDSGTDSP